MTSPLPYRDHERIHVPETGLVGKDRRTYYADPHLVAAANAAIVLGRALLLTGDPGCGKTDFAHAVAHAVGTDLLTCHVRSDSLARDLLYHYDSLQRFGDAHMEGESRVRSADARRYVEVRELGLALIAPRRQVVLIDEIDKAPRDLPNDLLHELDGDSFEIKELRDEYPPLGQGEVERARLETRWGQPLQRIMRRPAPSAGQPTNAPIVIITSNVERQLPEAFLRRCLFFHIRFPNHAQLTEILRAHVDDPPPYLDRLVPLFGGLRSIERISKKPATSELIDWAKVLRKLHHDADVSARIAPLVAELAQRRSLAPERWRELPALSCLLKLREDLTTVTGA